MLADDVRTEVNYILIVKAKEYPLCHPLVLGAALDVTLYFLPPFRELGLEAPRRCARSDAATSFSFLLDFGSLNIRLASEAGFLPVVIIIILRLAPRAHGLNLRLLPETIAT